MPWVTIDLMAGRSEEKKRLLHERIAKAVYETLEIAPEKVHVQLVEMQNIDYSIAGVPMDKQGK